MAKAYFNEKKRKKYKFRNKSVKQKIILSLLTFFNEALLVC